MSEHTPLPWHIPHPEDVYWIMNEDRKPVCCFSFQGDGKKRHLADAKFIVEACNNYDKLIAENKRLREALTYYKALYGNTGYSVTKESAQIAYNMARQALNESEIKHE